MPDYTKNLNIRLLEGSDRFVDDTFNIILKDMDDKLVGVSHLTSGAHFTIWEESTSYAIGDVIRTPYLKSGQFMECVTAGTSGLSMPTYDVDGTKFTDGTVSWVIRTLATTTDNTVSIWLSGSDYVAGSLVLYNNSLYRAKVKHTATSFEEDKDKWQEIYASVRNWKGGMFYDVKDSVIYDNSLYICVNANSDTVFTPINWLLVNNFSLVSEWCVSTDYRKNQLIISEGLIYKANATHISSSSAFSDDISYWDAVSANIRIWQSGVTYSVNDVVFCGNTCYICKNGHIAGTDIRQDISNWDLLIRNNAYLTDWTENNFYDSGQIVMHNGNIFRCLKANTDATFDSSKWNLIIQFINDWQTNTPYALGTIVIHNLVLYRCKLNHTSDALSFDNDIDKWAEISKTTIKEWNQNYPYVVGDVCRYEDKIFICKVAHTSSNSFSWDEFLELSPTRLYAWGSNRHYKLDDIVVYNNSIYRCVNPHTSGSAITDNYASWDVTAEITRWIPNWEYSTGQYVTNGDFHIYRCEAKHVSSSDFTTDELTYWHRLGSSCILDIWHPSTVYDSGQIIYKNNTLFKSNKRHVSSSIFSTDKDNWELIYANISDYSSGVYYLEGSLVIYEYAIYRCISSYQSSTTDLDKTKWVLVGGGFTISNWEDNKEYYVNACVINDGFLYSCIVKHTSGSVFDANNWINLSRPTLLDWQSEAKYELNQLVYHDNSIYRCLVATNGDTTFISNNWELLCSKYPDLIVHEWEPGKEYLQGIVAVFNNSLYWCASTHTSGATFKYDLSQGLWVALTVGGGGSGGTTNYTQISSADIVAPKTIDIPVEKTNTFCFPPVEILKFKSGTQDVVKNLLSFTFSDSTLYSVDGVSADSNDSVIFDGSAKLNTTYVYNTEETTALSSNYVHMSEDIDLSIFKNVDSLGVV